MDVEGTRQLPALTGEQRVSHFIFISIFGVDKIPEQYLQAKCEAEWIIAASGVPLQ